MALRQVWLKSRKRKKRTTGIKVLDVLVGLEPNAVAGNDGGHAVFLFERAVEEALWVCVDMCMLFSDRKIYNTAATLVDARTEDGDHLAEEAKASASIEAGVSRSVAMKSK